MQTTKSTKLKLRGQRPPRRRITSTMRLLPIRQYNKATATVALLLCMASSFSSLRVSANQYRHLAEDGIDKVTAALDSGSEQVTALATDGEPVAASTESGSEEVTAAAEKQATTEVLATELETGADGTEVLDVEDVAAQEYIYVVVDPHMSMATEPPVLPPTYGKGAVDEYYYHYYSKGAKSMKSKSKSKKHKSKHHDDDAYYVDSKGKGKGKGLDYDDEYYVESKGKGKGYYYHVETAAPEADTPTGAPAQSSVDSPSADEEDPTVPPEEEDQATEMPTTLSSTAGKGAYYYGKGYKSSKHKKSHGHETEYVYAYPEAPEEPEMPEHIFRKPVYHYPVYRSKSMKSHKMKSSAKTYYHYADEVPTTKGKGYPLPPGKGKGYYPAPTAAKGKGASPTPATKHTPAPNRSSSQDAGEPSPVPPSTNTTDTIPQQSVTAAADGVTGETITMADYWLSYELTSTDAPTSAMQLELEKVTADYVKNFFESNFAMSSVIHFTGATTSLLSSTYPEYPTPPAKVRFQTELDFAASSGHPQVAESEAGPSQYDDALRIAFEGDNAKSYLNIVMLLPEGNVYRTATSVSFEHESFTEQTAKMVTVPSPQLTTGTIAETSAGGLPGAPFANTSTTTTSGINTAGIAAAAGAGFFVLLVAGLVVYRNKRSEQDVRVSKYLSDDDGHITVAEETYTGASSIDSQSCIHQSSPSRDFGRSRIGLPATEEETTGREYSSSVNDTVSDKVDDDEGSEDSCSCVMEDEEV